MAGYHRVVIVEDDADLRGLVETLAELDGRFEVVGSAGDGEAGLEAVSSTQPDAVILDLELPKIDGIQLIGLIRETSPRTKIVVFSAFPDPFTLLDVLRMGADGYLDKAAAWAELLPTVAAVCEGASGRQTV
jgi:DNA-binding NarL/FixJ family response regulator